MTPADRLGVLLVGHGTRDAVGTRQFFELAELLAASIAPVPVEPALLEFQSPTIETAWERLVEAGVMHVIVSPLLLFSAGHAKQDIPGIVTRCQNQTPHVGWSQSRPLSRHPALIELAVERASTALARSPSAPTQSAFVLVGRGSYDPCAQADTRVLAELIGSRLNVAHTATAFYAMAVPTLDATLRELAESERFSDIVVQPHLLFEGRLHEAISHQVSLASVQYPLIRWHLADYLGPTVPIARAIAARASAAAGSEMLREGDLVGKA